MKRFFFIFCNVCICICCPSPGKKISLCWRRLLGKGRPEQERVSSRWMRRRPYAYKKTTRRSATRNRLPPMTVATPHISFATAMFTLRNCHVYASWMPCLCFMNAIFTIFKWWCFDFANMLCKEWKNVKTGAFLPRFCINIQNDRTIANKAFFFHNV